jgi:DNA helicase IV
MAESALAPAELTSERVFLTEARAALSRMHGDVLHREIPVIGGEDNDERFTNEANAAAHKARTQALVDLPDVPLFFGRLDYEAGTIEDLDRIYIGRRHVHDGNGAPLVIDWRAPVSVPFYRATRSDRQHVLLRRRYGFTDAADLTGFEDEPLIGVETDTDQADAFLRAEIERPRTGPMRDIVATIQPEQDDLVRAPLQPSVCVQGAPGTGKTAVGLHRVAYLLYTERERLSRGGVVIVGPNRSFLSYIRKVLPALGEVDVRQITIEELITQPVLATDDSGAARVKGDVRMADVLRRALWSYLGVPAEGVLYSKGSHRYRVHEHELAEIVTALRESTRYAPGRDALAQRVAHAVLVQMERRGDSPDDRVQNAVARSKPVRALLDAVWPKLVPEQVLHRLYSDAEFLAAVGEQLTDDERTALLRTKPARSWKSAQWSNADAILLDELADLIERHSGSLGHLVLDEAQDLSAMQLRALGRRCRTGSATILGDLAQATTPWAAGSWELVLQHLEKTDGIVAELDRGFRVPDQIIEFAAKLLPQIAPTLGIPRGVRTVADALAIVRTDEDALADALVTACREALGGEGSVALIAADNQIEVLRDVLAAAGLEPGLVGGAEDAMETARLVCVPATLAKGLEFDSVVVAEPARIVAAEPRGLQRLYVVLTRAVSHLQIVHSQPLPAALA